MNILLKIHQGWFFLLLIPLIPIIELLIDKILYITVTYPDRYPHYDDSFHWIVASAFALGIVGVIMLIQIELYHNKLQSHNLSSGSKK